MGLGALSSLFGGSLLLAAVPSTTTASVNPWCIDFRYAPPQWQTAICLPDDWQKSLVGKDGSLLYDYPGKQAGFGTRISFSLGGQTEWLKQELVSPRVPIVRTVHRSGNLEIVQEAFGVPTPRVTPQAPKPFLLERLGAGSVQTHWAAPPAGSDPAFADVAVGWNEPLKYRFKAKPQQDYTVVFGLCEGYHQKSGQRILTLEVENQALRTVDIVAERGHNQPAVFSFPVRDQDGDGWIELAVKAAEASPDKNTILNTLWVFADSRAPTENELLSGRSSQPPLTRLSCGTEAASNKPPRQDIVLVRVRNTSSQPVSISPTVQVQSDLAIIADLPDGEVKIGGGTSLGCSEAFVGVENRQGQALVRLHEKTIPGHGEQTLAYFVNRGVGVKTRPISSAQASAKRRQAEQFWHKLDLPYGHLQIPDAGIQALLDSAVRNIYQAREIKNGLPAFQVGPTCYRGLWVVDGSFLLEAMTYLGRTNETRNGVKYLMNFQRADGSFMLIDGHWKETGIALWAITRHARLTGDKEWLREAWPKVERGFAFIRQMRRMPAADSLNAGLIPDGFSDGGLAEQVPEYTNIYWTMVGMRAAIDAAHWLGLAAQAADWQAEYNDFHGTFRRAAQRDLRQDPYGNSYVPIRMRFDQKIPPQKAQWAFLHSIFPGKVFGADDPLVRGNMAMLRAVECQDLVFDTGWLKNGIWNYFASFYGHAWLWLGEGDKAARTLYAFGNHASPLLTWREEQMPVGQGEQVVGDMPHNWASAEFIRLVRHSLILERGDTLHLLEGVPAAWIKPGAVLKASDIATEFGPLSLEFRISGDGSSGILKLQPPRRTPPSRILLHLDHWSGQSGTWDLPTATTTNRKIKLHR